MLPALILNLSNLTKDMKMNVKMEDRKNIKDSMIVAGVLIAIIYWVLDSIFNIFFSSEFNFIAQLIGPDLYNVYIRLTVLCLFIIFGSHAQLSMNKLKQTKDLIREGEERLKTIFDNVQTGVVIVEPETHIIVDINPAATKIIGASKEQVVGSKCYNNTCPEGQDQCPLTDLEQNIENKEIVLVTDDKRHLSVLKTVVPVTLDGRKHLLESFLDITELKKAEEEKEKLRNQFHQAQKMEAIGTLAGGIAHDFNNLLMAIQGHTYLMLMDTDSSHHYFEHLKGIEDHVKSATGLTKQLLGFARGGKYEPKVTDLNHLIKNQNQMFARTRKEIVFHEKYEHNLWTVEVDQRQIEQVILNLYVNACHAMSGGGDLYIQTDNAIIDENYCMQYQVEPGKYVKISVTDTGVGMDEDTLQNIFDPFFTTKEIGIGTGLGLASVHVIIEKHGGFIDVYSEKGKGTTFQTYLPASEKEAAKEMKLHEEVIKGTETVLFVDDEDKIIDVCQNIMKALGYDVLIARSGKEAIEVFRKNQDSIDMVILDMVMPDMSGGDTYNKLKEINPGIKVLLSSGYSISGQARGILEKGCNGFIQKPFNVEDLSKKIREILDQ